MTRIIPINQVLQNSVRYIRSFCTKSEIKSVGIVGEEGKVKKHVMLINLCLVIGDEILKGQVTDTNSHYAAGVLHDLGVRLKKVNDC